MPHQRRPQVASCASLLSVMAMLAASALPLPTRAGELLPRHLPVAEYLRELRQQLHQQLSQQLSQQLGQKGEPRRRHWRDADSLRLPIPTPPDNASSLLPGQPAQPRTNLQHAPATGSWPDASSSIFERFWWQILLGGSLIILQGLLISALIFALRSRRATRDALHDERNQLEARVLQRTQELMQANAKLELLATTDPLTGIGNRRRMTEQINRELDRGRRFGHPLSLLMADIDHFKNVNDHYGHEAGDRVIIAVARTLAEGVRNIDMASRFGGEEFVLLMPETSITVATSAAERLRQEVANLEVKGDKGESIRFTISIGVAMAPPENTLETPSTLVSRADKALYQAKEMGRNRVVCSG